MTGREPLDKVLKVVGAYDRKHRKHPDHIVLGWEIAIDLCKCGRNEIGKLSDHVLKDGEEAFERHGLYAIPVEIDRSKFASTVEACRNGKSVAKKR